MFKIPLYKPSLGYKERQYLIEAYDSSWISSKGKFISLFEERFAQYLNIKHATSVCNGTAALHLSLLALGIGPGDEVIVPTFTYVASVNAIAYTGATPVFVDSLSDTLQMDPEDVRKKISSRTRAIIIVHIYGHPCDMNTLCRIAIDNDLFIIEDSSEAIGSTYDSKYCGTFGDIATFSFFGNKTITTGEGGMVVSNDEPLMNRIFRLKGQGLVAGREYWHDIVGYNYRMTNLCAAIGLAQLERIEEILEKKQRIAMWYKEGFHGLRNIRFHDQIGKVSHSYWMCSIILENVNKRDLLRKSLLNAGIETRPFFHPVHTMPMYEYGTSSFPVAETLSLCGINLPSYPDLTNEDVVFVVSETLKAIY